MMNKLDFTTEKITWYHHPRDNRASIYPVDGFVERTTTAMIYEDTECGLFTMSLLERGGPIVSAPTLEEVRSEFIEAFKAGLYFRSLVTMRGFKSSLSFRLGSMGLDSGNN